MKKFFERIAALMQDHLWFFITAQVLSFAFGIALSRLLHLLL